MAGYSGFGLKVQRGGRECVTKIPGCGMTPGSRGSVGA